MKLVLRLAVAAAIIAGMVPASASAGIWTQVDSGLPAGSTDIIQAIEYQGPERLWYGTGSGKLFRRSGGAMNQVHSVVGVQFLDIAFKPGGLHGIAVGSGGHIWRTDNGGSSWARVNFNTWPECETDSTDGGDIAQLTNPNISLYSVEWGAGSRIFISGEDQTYLRSTNDGETFTEINKYKDVEAGYPTYKTIYCRVYHSAVDLTVLGTEPAQPVNAIPLYMLNVDNNVRFSSDGLSSEPATRANLGCSTSIDKHLAVDPVNPARQWSTTSGTSGCFYRTEDDATYERIYAENPNGDDLGELHDVAAAGSPLTVVAVGKGGDILNSVDGQHFYLNRADGALATKDWHAVDGYDRDNFAVGGSGGTLIVTSSASTVPDLVAPAGTIAGPDTVDVGAPTAYTANVADNAGGSGIDPNGFAWSATGMAGATGAGPTLTFTSAGVHTLKVTFRDLAGNVGQATKTITVRAATSPPPPAPPVFTFPSATKPPVTGGSARKKGKYVTLKIKGKFKLPSGVSATDACKGNVILRVLKGKRLLTARVAKLSSTCGYAKKIRIARKKVGKARRLTLVVGFSGNRAIGAAERKYKVRVR